MKDLTIIIPAYNEEVGIRETIMALIESVKDKNWIIIVVNDGSTDNTGNILKGIENVKVLNHPYNKGYGASLKTGILNSKTEYIAFYDADGQHCPEDIISMYENLDSYDMLVGQRNNMSYNDWTRKPGKWLLAKFANFLTARRIPDLNSGLRVIKREIILRMLHLFPDGFSFSTTSTIGFINMGYNVGYYPIVVRKRVGKSTVKQLKHGSDTILLILRLIVLFNPLKVFLPTSIFLFLTGAIYELIFGIILIQNGNKLIPGAFFMMLTGILIFFFGLVVDQISEMRKHLNSSL